MRPRRAAQVLLAAAALGAAGCGDDDKSGGSSDSSTSSDGAAPAASVEKQLAQVSTDLKKEPRIPSLSGLPPMELVSKDIVTGTGAAAKQGDKITVEYLGVTYSDDKKLDSSWGREPLETSLDAASGIIDGWVKGIPGMKVGGRRALVIPPDLGYGEQGQPPDVAPFETLMFVIDLKKIG